MYPSNLNATLLPLYGSRVIITGDNGESLAIPYFGLGADLHTDIGTVFDYSQTNIWLHAGTLEVFHGIGSVPIAQQPNMTFNTGINIHDFPMAIFFLEFGSTELRWDIFEPDWNERDWAYPPVVGHNGYISPVVFYQPATQTGGLIINSSAEYTTTMPATYIDRQIGNDDAYEFGWLGQLVNGSMIAPGFYKMRFAALKPFADPKSSSSWDIFPTPKFQVLPPFAPH